MEAQNLLSDSRVSQRIRKCLRAPEFNILTLRSCAMGTMISANVADLTFYYQLRRSIRYGQLPWYSLDILIIAIGLLEAILAVFWSWFGRSKLRTLTCTTMLLCVSALTLWTLPSVPISTGSEFCSNTPDSSVSYLGMTTAGAVRLAIFIFAAASHAIVRSATWNHSLVILDEHDPGKLSIHYGTLILGRIMPVLMFPRVIDEDGAPWMLWLGIFLPGLIHVFQYWRLPEPISKDKVEDSECAEETDPGVLPSPVVVGQVFAVGLLVTALWGYLWHLKDILKMAFYVVEPPFFVTNQSDIIYYHAVILAVGVVSLKSTKRAPKFKKESAMKLATLVTVLVAPLYSVQTMLLTCDPGLVGGLQSQQNYTQPTCSSQCGCAVPYSEFDPVCVTDTMTTYLSPCHAGCEGRDTIGGLTVYRNCACAPGSGAQRATVGACGAVQCRSEFILHKAITIVIIVFTVLALQAHLVSLVHSVRPRHRAPTIGMVTSVTLILTLSCGHLVYTGIRAATCAWFEGGRCIFHSPAFLQALGGLSTGCAALSAIITFVTCLIILRRRPKPTTENIYLTQSTLTPQS